MLREVVCPHCRHRFEANRPPSVSEVKCPRCQKAVAIGPPRAAPPVAPPPGPPVAPIMPPPIARPTAASAAPPVDMGNTIRVPRRVVVTQGILLALMALSGFAAGVFSSRTRWATSGAARQPALVLGTVQFADGNNGEPQADRGSVILLFPRNVQPDRGQKLKVSGLRPQDPPLKRGNAALEALRTLGGDYARASDQGFYYVKARDTGDYFLLVLSAHEKRATSAALDRKHLAEIGRYVDRAAELIGSAKYKWQELTLTGDQRVDVVF